MKIPAVDLQAVGYFDSRDDMERTAPRDCGSIAQTPHVTWCFDGKDWIILRMEQYITFKSAVCKGQFRLPIHGIELTMTLMTTPKPGKDWGLVTSEETIGDYLTIRMYPDEDNNINV